MARMTQLAGFIAGIAVGASLATGAILADSVGAAAVEAGAQGQATSTIVFENARVRVKNATFPPGVTPMHTHDLPHVGVVIQGGTLEFRSPDGTTETMKLEPGGVGYRDANVTHQPVNTGKTLVRVIEVELK